MTDIINCTICLEQIVPPCCTFNTECKHIFHIKCYIRWDFKRNTCPLCRSKIRPWINNTNFNYIKIGNFIYDFNHNYAIAKLNKSVPLLYRNDALISFNSDEEKLYINWRFVGLIFYIIVYLESILPTNILFTELENSLNNGYIKYNTIINDKNEILKILQEKLDVLFNIHSIIYYPITNNIELLYNIKNYLEYK